MSQIHSWSIPTYGGYGRVARAVRRAREPQPNPELQSLSQRELVGRIRTTGLFTAPAGDGNPILLDVFLSSFSDQVEQAQVLVNRLEGDTLEPVFFRSIDVPAGGGRDLEVGEVGGETIEVSVLLASELIIPTAAVTQFFPADGGILTMIFKSAEDFVRV